jgi:bifunctional DNA-binding transcriptional regulator/antitoxin component of YhaV-PrlF toxin-antitoxin module
MKNNIVEKIQKMTSRGQITLPIGWRKKVKTEQIILKTVGDSIEISPFYLPNNKNTLGEYTVFDALRDNQGKGLKAKDLLLILKKING